MEAEVKAVGFDWDGTLLDSISIKASAFAESLREYFPEIAERESEVAEIYVRTTGMPRFMQLPKVYEKFDLEPLSDSGAQAWSDRFTAVYSGRRVQLFPGTLSLLSQLRARGYRLFLNSSVPQKDLEATVRGFAVADLFEVILGSNRECTVRKGEPHLTIVCRQLKLKANELAFAGDSPSDVRDAKAFGTMTIGRWDPRMPWTKERLSAERPDRLVSESSEIGGFFPGC